MARRRKSVDPNRQNRHFVVTMNCHPRTQERFPDPCDGELASHELHNLVQDSIRCLDETFGKDLRYRIVQLEKGEQSEASEEPKDEAPNDATGIHLQAYIESSRSIRLRTVWRSLPFAFVRPRAGLRDTAREYCMPEKGSPFVGNFDPTHLAGPWEVGSWRVSEADETADDPLEMATRFIIMGGDIVDCAMRFPKTFVRHGRGLRDLHATIHGLDRF